MEEITFQQFSEAFSKTDQNILHVLASEETATAIRTITTRQNASEYSSDIAAVVGYVMVGLVPVKKFILTLQEEAELEEETARQVAYDIRSQIFAPVAKELAEMQPKLPGSHIAGNNNRTNIHPDNIINLRE